MGECQYSKLNAIGYREQTGEKQGLENVGFFYKVD